MLSPSEFSTLLKDRAEAATRVLERRRTSLEAAIEALEVVGCKVYQGNDGAYSVQPPRDRASEYDAYPTVKPTPESKGAFLADYPAMLTIKDIAEITGLHTNSIRRLCRDGNIPSMKFGQKIVIPKDIFVEELGIGEGEKIAIPTTIELKGLGGQVSELARRSISL